MTIEEHVEIINDLIKRDEGAPISALDKEKIAVLDAEQKALILEGLPIEQRLVFWEEIPAEQRIDTLMMMHGESRRSIFKSQSTAAMELLLSQTDAEHLIELYDDIPGELRDIVIDTLDSRQRKYVEQALTYSDDQAGRYVRRDIAVLPAVSTVRDGIALLKRKAFGEFSHCIFLYDRKRNYVGAVSFLSLFKASPEEGISTIVDPEIGFLEASEQIEDSVAKIEASGYGALPVVEKGRVIGQLTIQDALDILRETYENSLMASAGLKEEEDLFAPVGRSVSRRATWLGINLLTALLASWTIGLFEATVAQVVALAVLMPVVASMGGIAGTQTLTLVIRGLALGHVFGGNIRPLVVKEVKVGAVNALLWAVVIAVVSGLWFSSPGIALVIFVAIIVNIVCAAFAGVWIPVLLERFDLDPALSGAVILTTVSDVVGFFTFLGLGTLFLI